MKYFHTDNAELTATIDTFFAKLNDINDKQFGSQLSIVLLGSMSRGEATWILDNGHPHLVSDIEFFTVYPKGFNLFNKFTAILHKTAKECFQNEPSTLFHIDNTYCCKEYIPLMERKVITFDAMNMGKCVVGPDVMHLFPKITLENINQEDIWDVMIHRCFSVLYYGKPLRDNGKTNEYQYNLAKNSLDLTTVLLAHHGILNSGFTAKVEACQSLPLSDKWKKYFAFCLSIKLNQSPETEFSVNDMENLFLELVTYLKDNYKVSIRNRILNLKSVLRRRMGMLKRMIQRRTIVTGRESLLQELIKCLSNNNPVSSQIISHNYVLNGYPQ